MPDLFAYAEANHQRRIDVTIERVKAEVLALPRGQQEELRRQQFWAITEVVLEVRAMERGDGGNDLADAYDRVVTPGGNALQALVDTFREAFGETANA